MAKQTWQEIVERKKEAQNVELQPWLSRSRGMPALGEEERPLGDIATLVGRLTRKEMSAEDLVYQVIQR